MPVPVQIWAMAAGCRAGRLLRPRALVSMALAQQLAGLQMIQQPQNCSGKHSQSSTWLAKEPTW